MVACAGRHRPHRGDLERLPGNLGGPFLFGSKPCIADAMFAPVVTRFITYDVPLDPACVAYCETLMALPAMKEWVAAAESEPDEIDELDAEF